MSKLTEAMAPSPKARVVDDVDDAQTRPRLLRLMPVPGCCRVLGFDVWIWCV